MDLNAKCIFAQPMFFSCSIDINFHTETSILSLRTVRIQRSESLPFPCEYALSLVNLNHEKFQTNSAVHSINKKNKYHLHTLFAVVCFQKIIFYPEIKVSRCTADGELNLKMRIRNTQKTVIVHCTHLYSFLLPLLQKLYYTIKETCIQYFSLNFWFLVPIHKHLLL
jgi:hypothetical protein